MNYKFYLSLVVYLVSYCSSGFAQDCDSILITSGPNVNITSRSQQVAGCIDQASEIARGIYLANFQVCERFTLSSPRAKPIELRNGKTTDAAYREESWEDYAYRISEGDGLMGCRDGIRSALLQKGFFSADKVRTMFEQTELYLEDVYNGEYQVKARSFLGTIPLDMNITESTVIGRFLQVDAISADQTTIQFKNVSFVASGALKAEVDLPLVGQLEVETPYYSEGAISGSLNLSDLSINVDASSLNRLDLEDSSLTNAGVKELNRTIEQFNFRRDLSLFLTEKLRQSYQSIDPFQYIRNRV